MEADIKGMSIKMVKEKDLDYLEQNLAINIQENGIRVNYMGLPSVHIQVVTVIGGNARMVTTKDMDQLTGLMDRDTKGNGSTVSNTGMEYTDGKEEQYIMGNSNRIREMVMAIIGGHLAMNTTESSRMMNYGERES
jgi:hypothetical protein